MSGPGVLCARHNSQNLAHKCITMLLQIAKLILAGCAFSDSGSMLQYWLLLALSCSVRTASRVFCSLLHSFIPSRSLLLLSQPTLDFPILGRSRDRIGSTNLLPRPSQVTNSTITQYSPTHLSILLNLRIAGRSTEHARVLQGKPGTCI